MNRISKKIFVIVFIALLISFVLSLYFQIHSYNHELGVISDNSLIIAENSFEDILSSEKQKLSLALDFLLEDKAAKQMFIDRNIDSLYDYTKPIFEKLKNQYSITHLYFILPEPEKTCFLRVHNRPKNNDVITRFTYENSVNTKKIATGLELGKTAFALRAVRPYYDNNKLIGYMEVGQEIDNFFDLIKSRTKDDFFVTVNKKYLDKNKWNSAKETNSQMSLWEALEKEVIITSTSQNTSLSNLNLQNIPNKSTIIDKQLKINNKVYILGQFPLTDAGDRKVGAIYFTHDNTGVYSELKQDILQMLAVFFVLLIVFGIFTVFFVRQFITKPINIVVNAMKKISNKQINFHIEETQKDEIGELYRSINEINNNFQEIITNINTITTAVLDTSNQLNMLSLQITERANIQASTTEEIAASMEQMVATINSNTGYAEITGNSSTKSANGIKKSNKIFKQTIKSVSEISEKITIITEIADKTDILSINAAIEAARVGEAGRGFGVVAQEIRKLADKTKLASDEINRLSREGQVISKSAGEELARTIPEIVQSAKLVNEIVLASREQQNSVEAINISVLQLSDITNENTSSAAEMSISAEKLSAQAEELRNLISIFEIK